MNRKVKSILSAVITGGLIMTCGGVVFADNLNSTTTTENTLTKQTKAHRIGPDQAGGLGQAGGPLARHMENASEEMQTLLATLVTDGTLTQTEVDNITAFMATKETEREAEQAKLAAMTETERKAYHDQKETTITTTTTPTKVDRFSEMVTSGVITQAQADTITAKIEAQKLATRQAEQTARWQTLVASSIITDEQVEQIIAYQATEKATRKTEMEKLKDMTKDERDAYLETSKGTSPKDPMSGLVDAGIITQDQADSIKAEDEAQRLATRQAEQKTRFDTLVASNTITAAQVEQILAYEVTQDAARKAERDKVEAMSSEERATYLETSKGTPKDPMAGLVDAGILTQEQADSVAKVMSSGHAHGQKK